MKKETLYKGKFLNMVKDESGWEYVERSGVEKNKPDAVVIIAKLEDGSYVCIKEKRNPLKEVTDKGIELSFPAGLIDEWETAITSAARELKEETGYILDEILNISPIYYNSAGLTNESCIIVYCTVIYGGKQDLQGDEEIEVIKIKNSNELKIYNSMGYSISTKLGQFFDDLDLLS